MARYLLKKQEGSQHEKIMLSGHAAQTLPRMKLILLHSLFTFKSAIHGKNPQPRMKVFLLHSLLTTHFQARKKKKPGLKNVRFGWGDK